MDQTPIFAKVEQDLAIKITTLTSPPYEFARHDAEVRRRIATERATETPSPDVAPEALQQG